jgi:hypothetical protein
MKERDYSWSADESWPPTRLRFMGQNGHVDGTDYVRADLANVAPIPLRLNCPTCGALHIDEGEFATKPHHTHSCQSCGMTWRPAVAPTVGVQFLPGFKNNP